MNQTITHKHLKRQFETFEETEDLSDLFTELEYSTLLLPVDIGNDTLTFPILSAEGMNFAPVFTDIHEYNKCNIPENYIPDTNGFDFYLHLLDEKIDGIIVDVEGERFPLTRELKQFIKPNDIFNYESITLTSEDIKKLKNSIDNSELEEFLADESNQWDFDGLLTLLLKSNLFEIVLSRENLSYKAEDGIVPLKDIGRLPTAMAGSLTQRYALLYTSESEIRPKKSPMHPYMQLVNLPEFIQGILKNDLDGIILNENSQNITIPRESLLHFLKNLESPDLNSYYDYAFPLTV